MRKTNLLSLIAGVTALIALPIASQAAHHEADEAPAPAEEAAPADEAAPAEEAAPADEAAPSE